MLRPFHLEPTKPPTVIKYLKITKMHSITLTKFYLPQVCTRYIWDHQTWRFVENFNRILISYGMLFHQRSLIVLQIFDIYLPLRKSFSRSAGKKIASFQNHEPHKRIN